MSEEKRLSRPLKEKSISIQLLILSDASSVVNSIVSTLAQAQLAIAWQQITTKQEYDSIISQSQPDLVLYDAALSTISLDEALNSVSTSDRQIPLLVVNAEQNIPSAVAAIKAGATDYLTPEALTKLPEIVLSTHKESSFCPETQPATEIELQLQKLISQNADGILVVDDRGTVRFVNPASVKLLGKSKEELMSTPFGFPVVNGDFLEVDLPVSPDKILVAQMRVSQIQWQGADASLVSLRDITQLKQAEEEIAQLLQESRSANRAKDEFLAVLSHELRTPLNPIMGWSQLLVKGGLSEAQIARGAEIIQRNAMLQTQLIADILDISRMIRGKLELHPIPLNLAEVIDHAIETVNLSAQAKSIKIVTELDRDLGLVRGDATRLQQVVWNLLTNAVKFTSHGGSVKVGLTAVDLPFGNLPEFDITGDIAKQPFSYAQIQVIDSGKGIQPEFLPYVFDYFRQAESSKSRSEGGLGLGLAIVRRITELHGGEVSVTSPGLGKGATFTVLLPLLGAEE